MGLAALLHAASHNLRLVAQVPIAITCTTMSHMAVSDQELGNFLEIPRYDSTYSHMVFYASETPAS